MPATRRPEIFISATSADLRTCRALINQAVLTLQCVPVEQTNFPPDHRTVRDMLRTKIAACDAVIHVAGVIYGAEPSVRAPGEPRRSYTQLEYDLARELKKPLYVFVCGEDFPYDDHEPEDAAKRTLQQAHRDALSASETLRYKIGTRDELGLRIRELQIALDAMGKELNQTRSWLARGVAAGLAAVVLLGGGLWTLREQTHRDQAEQQRRNEDRDRQARREAERADRTEHRVTQLETEVEKQRRYIAAVAGEFVQLQRQLRARQADDGDIFTRAVAAYAEREKIPAADLSAAIELFVTATRRDPTASDYDRALADFATRDFAGAASRAGQAAAAARVRRLAGEKLAAESARQAEEARLQEFAALLLQGKSLSAQENFAGAAAVLREAGALVRPDEAGLRGDVQLLLGTALSRLAGTQPAAEARRLRADARGAFETALASDTDLYRIPATYNLAALELEHGAAETGLERLRAWRRAEALFTDLRGKSFPFVANHREQIARGFFLSRYLLADEFGGDLRPRLLASLTQTLQHEYDFIGKTGFGREPDKQQARFAPLAEIAAAVRVALARLSHDPVEQGEHYRAARDDISLALHHARPADHAASLANNLGLVLAYLAFNGWGELGAKLMDPDLGGPLAQEIAPQSDATRERHWQDAFAQFVAAQRAFPADHHPAEHATVAANHGLARALRALSLPDGSERQQEVASARRLWAESLALARQHGLPAADFIAAWDKRLAAPARPAAATPAPAAGALDYDAGRFLWTAHYRIEAF